METKPPTLLPNISFNKKNKNPPTINRCTMKEEEEETTKPKEPSQWTKHIHFVFITEHNLKVSWEGDYPRVSENWMDIQEPSKDEINAKEKNKRTLEFQRFCKGKEDSNSDDDDDDDFFQVEENRLTLEEINEVIRKSEKKNLYNLTEVETRCILLCGRSRTGKSTTMEVLKSPQFIPKTSSIFADTTKTHFHDFAVQLKNGKTSISIKAIDTPGLFEVTEKDRKEKSTEKIMDMIGQCLEREVAYVHAILFFATVEGGVNKEDIKAMELLTEMFGSKVKFGLVITRAESKTKDWKKKVFGELKRHEKFRKIITNNKIKLFFSGVIHPFQYTSKEDLLKKYESVRNMRKKILKFIIDINVKEKKLLREMPYIRDRIKIVKKDLTILIRHFDWFLLKKRSIRDFETEKRIYSVREKIEKVFGSQNFVVGMDMTKLENIKLTNIFQERLKAFRESKFYDEEIKKKLLGVYYK